ncbi:Activator of Hsp90 ATPase 1 family protein [Flammeovirgaceae bacterium 311]|nr:Activator of Hsp90 ATPase 1 family protein [Flammeovirgaceae bacterium 311]
METAEKKILTVAATINAPVEKVWKLWTEPDHITKWNNASDDWHTPRAENDLREGGKFLSRMEARDGSMGFDFEGVYQEVEPYQLLTYTLLDGRQVKIKFDAQDDKTTVTESFEAENTHSLEMQQDGWQAILDNFKKYTESQPGLESLHFEIEINAPVEKVYTSMLDKELYKAWTAAFNPGSYYEGSWQKGSKILFIGTDQDGSLGGMVSRIKENIPHKFVSIEHLGVYQHGKEITSGKEVEGWAGAQENYSFQDLNGSTLLSIDMDSNEQFKGYFSETWPRALAKLKAICEA